MQDLRSGNRVDRASIVIHARAEHIYDAYLEPSSVAIWRPPAGMTCRIFTFEPFEGGRFRMSFDYVDTNHPVPGKTSEHADFFHGIFLELIRGERIVELVEFESQDPGFSGSMKITTSFEPVNAGTRVTIVCENVPPGIRPEDHEKGMTSTLHKLSSFFASEGGG